MGGVDKNKQMAFCDTSLQMVQSVMGPLTDVCVFAKGYFLSSVKNEHKTIVYSIVSIDCDLYEPIKAALNFFYGRMSKGGLFLLHDYLNLSWDGAKKAIDEFCAVQGVYLILLPDKSGSAFLIKNI